MKLNLVMPRPYFDANHIATFGNAHLMRKYNGDYHIVGGSPVDHTAAKEWVSMFMHEAAITFAPVLAKRVAA